MMEFAERVAARAAQSSAAGARRQGAERRTPWQPALPYKLDVYATDAERNAEMLRVLAPFALEIRHTLQRISGDAAYQSVFGDRTPELNTRVPARIGFLSVAMDDTGEDHVFRVSIEFSAESYRKIDVSVAFLSDDMVTPVGKRTLSDYRFHSRGYRESDPATQTFTLPSEAAEFVEDTLAAYVAANAPAEQAEQERSAEPGFFGRLFGR